ncbi:MAG: YeeE/YedE thiosulfate transporter family protein [Bacteroides sp.]|nr:YeeE/YedE thiosulfate transporter family protein [Bacteroides sp.]
MKTLTNQSSWLKGGLLLGTVFLVAVWLVKPAGVSTQFVVLDGIVWNALSPDLITKDDISQKYSSSNAYLNKSGGKYASLVANPLSYGFIFVLSMLVGGFVSGKFSRKKVTEENRISPQIWRDRFGNSAWKRYAFAFLAGFLALFGARLAGGCTSGHMMSGMMQTSLSGYLFAAGAFATGIPLAILVFNSKKR